MAQAIATTTKEKKMVEVEVPTKAITLTLSAEEGALIRALCGMCGGDPESSARKFTDSVCKALRPHVPVLTVLTIAPGARSVMFESGSSAKVERLCGGSTLPAGSCGFTSFTTESF
jgi:hypothetical protein